MAQSLNLTRNINDIEFIIESQLIAINTLLALAFQRLQSRIVGSVSSFFKRCKKNTEFITTLFYKHFLLLLSFFAAEAANVAYLATKSTNLMIICLNLFVLMLVNFYFIKNCKFLGTNNEFNNY